MTAVLVSGAGRGIGLACTTRLAARGVTVYAGARSAEHLALLSEMSGVIPVSLDVTDADSVAALEDLLPDSLDGVVNNAGIAIQGMIEAVPPEELVRQLDVNVVGSMRLTQAVLPRIRKATGRIVVISSLGGLVSTPGTGIYCASKFAVEGLYDALRIELREWNIQVSLIEPGPTGTDMWGTVVDELDAATAKMSPEHHALYDRQLTRLRRMLPGLQKGAIDPDRVAERVEHALTSSRPRRRYRCDTRSELQAFSGRYAPTAVVDNFLALSKAR